MRNIRLADTQTGIRKGGAVVHYSTDGLISLCGRMLVKGDQDGKRACKSCVRVGHLVIAPVEQSLRALVDASCFAERADKFIREPRAAHAWMMLRDVVTEWENGEYPGDKRQKAYAALCALALEYRALKADGVRAVEVKRDHTQRNGDARIGGANKRGNLTDNQRNALIKMSSFENALIKEIRELQGKSIPELTVLDDTFFATLTTRTMVDKLFTTLSTSIDKLKTERDSLRKTAQIKSSPAKTASEVITQGMYKVGERVFKVKPTQAGKLWAHELVGSTADGFSFEFAGNPARFVKPENKMTLEEAKAFGKITGTCCVCGRMLTKQSSIDNGIGPICEQGF